VGFGALIARVWRKKAKEEEEEQRERR